MLVTWPCCMAAIYESASISYIIPTAECDLQLSLMDKGILNAVSYAGERWKFYTELHSIVSSKHYHYRNDNVRNTMGILCGSFGTPPTSHLRTALGFVVHVQQLIDSQCVCVNVLEISRWLDVITIALSGAVIVGLSITRTQFIYTSI